MAYPGVGILAGDNSQYLSVVTAHGVIMVFFMAMPLLFGFFGNFLLPTQMGVHDVAFPRMNSAAFWFLPASLLALCQLVCIDRRYQRMNCFNVRELQSLVRNKFFFDVAPHTIVKDLFYKPAATLQFKLNFNTDLGLLNYNLINNFFIATKQRTGWVTTSDFFPLLKQGCDLGGQASLSFIESGNNLRFLNLKTPNLLYKIKIGNYLPEDIYNNNFGFLLSTITQKSVSGKNSIWYNSINLLQMTSNSAFFTTHLTQTFNLQKLNQFSVFAFSNQLKEHLIITNKKLTAPYTNNSITDFFFSQSKQMRLLNNWRNLKLTREGWRCRMLTARHQRSLYRRYVNENDVIWIVEKNAKDLLPGWAMITPFSSRLRYTLSGKVDIGVLILVVTLTASMIASANFLMTYRYLSTLNNRKMRDARSFFTEAVIAASWMMIAANPMLILGLLMLISDRHWRTCFFDYSGGGDTVLFQHMFWFFGHPEVYIIILPCFGITNTLLSFYLRKRISARASLLYSLYTIAFLGFFVWGHHMYMVGLSHTTRMLYSTLTVMISVPAATKIMHWLVTFINSSIHFEVPLILTLCFVFYFVSGGISGMAVAHTGMDILFHDTFYVIGHFHVMFAGSLLFAGFAAFYFYLPALFGVRYSRLFTYLHVFYYSLGQIFTVIPMIWLGYLGMPRRVLDYPSAMGGWHSLISSAHVITIAGILAFVLMLFESLRKKRSYVIKTFGVGRYNTRLNFYFYQINRNRYWVAKHLTLLSFWHSLRLQTSRGFFYKLKNVEIYETTLVYYLI